MRSGLLDALADTPVGCAFVPRRIAARELVPLRWFDDFELAIVRRGVVIRQRVSASGATVSVDAVGPGSLLPLGVQVGRTGACSAYAATDVALCLASRRAMDEHDDGSCLGDLLRLESLALERVERLVDARGRATATAKVAGLLCALADTLSPEPGRTRLPHALQRADMAALLVMRRETFCRALGDLVRRGLVERGPDGIQLLDRNGLEAAATQPSQRISGVRIRAIHSDDRDVDEEAS
jgi:CRP-like cAMP-binding protein